MYASGMPEDVFTSKNHGHRRWQVDVGQTGLTEGREFRTFVRFNIGTGAKLYMRFTSPVPFVIFDETIVISDGEIDSTASRTATSVSGSWTPAPQIGRSTAPDRPFPYYTPQALLDYGGTYTPGVEVGPPILIKTSGATGQQTSVHGSNSRERKLDAGTYYIYISAITAAKGCYYLEWEEKP